jgi:hypothetical protein
VSFLAACGIDVLADITEQARAQGMALWLVTQTPLVLRALQVTLAKQLVSRAATVAEAVAQCAGLTPTSPTDRQPGSGSGAARLERARLWWLTADGADDLNR